MNVPEDNLDVYKKDKNVVKFMNKYRYQYHVTMLPDLAELVRDAYLEGYRNGLSQHLGKESHDTPS